MNRSHLAGLALVLGVGAGCAPPGGTTGDQDSEALQLAAAQAMARVSDRDTLDVAHGFFVMGDNAADFTAWFEDGGEPVFIREHNGMGDWGNGTARYYLEGGELAYYVGEHIRIDLQDPTAPRRRLYEIQVLFDPPAPMTGRGATEDPGRGRTSSGLANLPPYSGTVTGQKRVDGVRVELEEGEIAGIRVRAAVMADSARSARERGGR